MEVKKWNHIFKKDIKAQIDAVNVLKLEVKDKRKNVKKGLIKKKLRRKFGGRIKKLNLVLERQGIVGSEMGKQLGNDYARKIVRLREIL